MHSVAWQCLTDGQLYEGEADFVIIHPDHGLIVLEVKGGGIEVHNGLDRPILLSPGQFRLQVGLDGPSVAPYDFELAVREVAAHATVSGWISYLAPPGGAAALSLSYDDVARSEPTTLVLEVAPLASDGGTQ